MNAGLGQPEKICRNSYTPYVSAIGRNENFVSEIQANQSVWHTPKKWRARC